MLGKRSRKTLKLHETHQFFVFSRIFRNASAILVSESRRFADSPLGDIVVCSWVRVMICSVNGENAASMMQRK